MRKWNKPVIGELDVGFTENDSILGAPPDGVIYAHDGIQFMGAGEGSDIKDAGYRRVN
jgi:hypothetical protein